MSDGEGEQGGVDEYTELQRRAMLAGIDSSLSLAKLRKRLAETEKDQK